MKSESILHSLSNKFTLLEQTIFYLLVFFLPTQFGKHFWPDFSYNYGVRIDYLSPTLYLTDILIFAIIVGFLLNVIKGDKDNKTSNNFKYLKFIHFKLIKNFKLKIKNYLYILFLFLFILIGIIISRSPLAGLYGLIKFFEFVFLGFYVSRFIKAREILNNIIFIFSLGVLLESFLAIAQYINNGSIGGLFYLLGERSFNQQTIGIAKSVIDGQLVLRPYATFPHPNVLAGYLVIAMTILISNVKYQISRNKFSTFNSQLSIIIMVSSLGFGTIALFLTLSRIAILLWVIILIFVLLRQFIVLLKKSKSVVFPSIWKGTYYLFFIFLLTGVFSAIFFTSIRFRFMETNLRNESFIVREDLIKSSINMIKDSPILGVGLNNFLQNLPKENNLKNRNIFTYLQPVHNIYLLIWSQLGTVGFIVFVGFLFKTISKIKDSYSNEVLGNKKKTKINSQLSTLNSQLLIVVLILGLFDHYFLTIQQGQILSSFVLGLCWMKYRI